MADTPERDELFERRRAHSGAKGRRRRSAMPWIVAAVALLGVVLLWPERAGMPEGSYVLGDADVAVVSDSLVDVEAAVGDFARFVTARRARDVIGPKHEYTAEGIRRIATAIAAIALQDSVSGGALAPRIAALRARADELQRDPNASTHASKAREAFLLAGSMLETIQDHRFPALDRDAVTVVRAAEGVTARRPLTDQPDAVERFFERTAHLLRAMTAASD